MGDFNAAVLVLEGYLNTPEDYFVRPDVVVFQQCSKVTKGFFDTAKQGPIKGGPLTELMVEGFDSEQIWQQLELDNQPVLQHLETEVTALENAPVGKVQEEGDELDEDGEGDEGAEGDEGEDGLSAVDEDEGDGLLGLDEDDEGDALVSRGHKRSSAPVNQATKRFRADRDPALGGNILTFDDESSGEDEDEGEGDLEDEEERVPGLGDGGDEGDLGPGEDEDENPFFDLEAMNKFADEGMEDDEDGEEEGDDEDEEGGKGKGMTYKDFFDAPPAKGKKSKGSGAPVRKNEDDHLLSSFQRNERDMKKRIEAMEDELIKPRTWTLTGEVPASARPAESLLQEDLDFEYATRPTEGLTEEGSKKLEDIIKNRIIDGLFDDVERKQAPKKKVFKPLEEVSSSKSEVGLAEVYAKEFQELAKGEDEPTAAEAKLDKEHQEIATLFGALCHKLDALSDFSFTPKPPTEEVTVITNAPAISMEENIPMAVSSGTLTAPEEEYKSKSIGKPVGATELEKAEKRTRRARQKRLHQARAETRAREKGPDKKAEKKEIDSILNQRHVKEGVVSDTTKYGTSKEVFAKLTQTTLVDPFARKKTKAAKSETETKLGGHSQDSKAASLKL